MKTPARVLVEQVRNIRESGRFERGQMPSPRGVQAVDISEFIKD